MKPKTSAAIVAGVVSLAAAAGITYAIVQPASQKAVVSPSVGPSPAAQEAPTAPRPVANPPIVAQAPNTTRSASDSTVQTGSATPDQPAETSTAPTRNVEFCGVSMAIVKDPNSPLNVRSAPSTGSNLVGSLENGTWVNVATEKDGWFQISSPISGWIAKNRTENDCNKRVERINFSTNGGTLTISDRFVGTGNHKYVIPLQKGQRLTITRSTGPLPYMTAPDGSYVLDGPSDTRPSWSGQLDKTGEYTVQLDSNYRGYEYSFLVEVE